MPIRTALRASLSLAALACGANTARAQEAQPAPAPAVADEIVVTAKTTRSATAITGAEIQKILPGTGPLKAIETLPGVLFITADPWGNNEQNSQIFIHGFNFQQLGYTLDGLPLGDQNYGNYNGLSPQRAVISENTGRVVVSTGAGDLATPSTSNLGGTVDVFTSDPTPGFGARVAETVGSYGTSRTYARIDSGTFGNGNSLYVSGDRQRARAFDFNGIQGGYRANGKFIHGDAAGKLTLYFDYSDKTEPNEDATTFFKPSAGAAPATAAQLYTPYTRPYLYPDFAGNRAYIDAFGNTPAAQGSNYRNYYSDAQRTDYLGYARYEAHLTGKLDWTNQFYAHHDDGVGVVAGPLGQSITVIQAYLDPNYAADCKFGGNGNGTFPASCKTMTAAQGQAIGNSLLAQTGGSGLVTRTTEYRIDREGLISTLNLDLGPHQVELGGWFEHNSATQWRRWYAVPVGSPQLSTPYIRPLDVEAPLFTQYQGEARVNELQFHLQDSWTVTPRLFVQAGFKTSAQYADGYYPVQPVAGSLSGLSGGLPQGVIDTKRWFLPAIGARCELTGHEEVYVNVQRNLHQYMTYEGGASLSPWFQGSQTAFNAFAASGQPESSWTYEAGLRTHRSFAGSFVTGFEGQINYYHVTFSNRQLAINTNPGGIAGGGITGGTAILTNVGTVYTDGVDAAGTLHFGRAFSLYNAFSFNNSFYQSDYTQTALGIGAATGTCIGGYTVQSVAVNGTATNVVPTCGKRIPGTPRILDKTVASLSVAPFDLQVIGDYVGRRFATYTNDTSVRSYFLMSLRAAIAIPPALVAGHKAELSLNVTNVTGRTGFDTISIGSATNTYSAYPIPPRQYFGTISLAY